MRKVLTKNFPTKLKQIQLLLYSLIIFFLAVICLIIIPFPSVTKRQLFPFLAVFSLAFFVLGAILLFLTLKTKTINPKFKKFLILTGASSVGFLLSVLLHNFLYALSVLVQHVSLLHNLAEFLHATFFIIGIFIYPIVFVVGIIGSIIQLRHQ